MELAFVYSGIVLLLTAAWVFLLRHKSFQFLAYLMYFPTLIAIPFSFLSGSGLLSFLSQVFNPSLASLYGLIAGIVYVVVVVLGCAVASIVMGWGRLVFDSSTLSKPRDPVHPHNRNLILAFLRATGEEIGWRGYLLPLLMSVYSPFVALLISGIVWALYHVPIMILLVKRMAVPDPVAVCVVEALSCAISAFCFGYLGIVSQYSVWAPAFAHFFWNQLNPLVLGSIYTQTQGLVVGTIWKLNGEGLMGCILGAFFAAWVVCNVPA